MFLIMVSINAYASAQQHAVEGAVGARDSPNGWPGYCSKEVVNSLDVMNGVFYK